MIKQRNLGVRALLAGASVLMAAMSVACGQGGPEPSSTPSTTAGTSVTSAPNDVRGRLASALQGSSPAYAKLVENPKTKLTPVDAAWLKGWQILDVANNVPPHPQRFYAALSDDSRAEVLSGRPDAFSAVLFDADGAIYSADVAADVGALFLDATRDFRTYAYRIDSVEDIKWRPTLTSDEQAARDGLVKSYRSKVKPPQVADSGDGWQVTIWMVQGRDLVKHEVGLASGIAVTDETETLEQDIPVPFSV
jgi:hypothetical protein